MQIGLNLVAFNVHTTNGSNSGQIIVPGPSVQYSPPQSTPYQSPNATDVFIPPNYSPNSFGRGSGRGDNFNNSNKPVPVVWKVQISSNTMLVSIFSFL